MRENVIRLVTRTDMISTESVLRLLKEKIEEIEKGEIKPDQAVLILAMPCAGEWGACNYMYADSGLTMEQMHWMVSKCASHLLQQGRE